MAAAKKLIKVDCLKCFGKGRINGFEHIQMGVCFSCNGAGFKMQKNPSRVSKEFRVYFLWLDKNDCNYNDGDFCHCGQKKFPSQNKADQWGAKTSATNGSSDYKIELITEA